MQHTCNTSTFLRILNESARFGITTLKEELGRQASKRALSLSTFIENSQESARVARRVACVLHVSCM